MLGRVSYWITAIEMMKNVHDIFWADWCWTLTSLSPALSQLLALSRCFSLLLPVLLGWLPRPQPCQSWASLCPPCRQRRQSSASTGHLGRAVGGFLHLRASTEAAAPAESIRSFRGFEPFQPPVSLPLAWARRHSCDRFLQRCWGGRGIHRGDRRVGPTHWPHLAASRWPICAVIRGSVGLSAVHRPIRGGGVRVPEGTNRRQPPGAADRGHPVTWLPPEPTPCHQDHTVHTRMEAQDLKHTCAHTHTHTLSW